MLRDIVEKLDRWVVRQNLSALDEGRPLLRACRIRLVGQMALFEMGAPLTLAVTNDVDVRADYEHATQQKFGRLLAGAGKYLDPVGHEAWMPSQTRYSPVYQGQYVTLLVADLESVLVSKALKAPAKNGPLLTEYLASGPSPRFMDLARSHGLDLEQFL